jgi:uncharacterized membrane protein YdbT with pleckstrin-like domain
MTDLVQTSPAMADGTADSFRSSTKGWLLGTLGGIGTLLMIPLALILCIPNLGLHLGLWPLLLIVVALGLIGWRWMSNLATTYEITPDRLMIRQGIFFKSIDEIELYRIKDIRIAFTLLNQMANVGSLSITSSDETTKDGPLVMSLIQDAKRRRETLRTLVDTARQKRRVREVDMFNDDAH